MATQTKVKRLTKTAPAAKNVAKKAESAVRRPPARKEQDRLSTELRQRVMKKIEDYMESEDITRGDLAKRLKVTEGRVSQILAGTENLTIRSLARVGHALGIEFNFSHKKL